MTVAMTLSDAASGQFETDFKSAAVRVNTRVGDKTESISLPCGAYPGSAALAGVDDAAEAAHKLVTTYIQPYTAARVQSVTATLYRNTNASTVPSDAAGAGASHIFVFEYFQTAAADPLQSPRRAAMKIPHFEGNGETLFASWKADVDLPLLITPIPNVDVAKTKLIDHKGARNIT